MIDQWMTPQWVAERIFEVYYAHLGPWDSVLEPTCGDGAFLCAVPDEVPAIGVEIDPRLAELARANSGREVITGDFCTVTLPVTPTHIIGNPPFAIQHFERILGRCREVLPEDGTAGFILSTRTFQTVDRVLAYADTWGMRVELIPRQIFGRMHEPLVFATFRKGGRRMVGLALYGETADIKRLEKRYQALLATTSRSAWRAAVAQAAIELGGRFTLPEIYEEMQRRRPTGNKWWREKVRQILGSDYARVGEGKYEIPASLAEAA